MELSQRRKMKKYCSEICAEKDQMAHEL
ncbi:YdaE family protein [Escherichia coli]